MDIVFLSILGKGIDFSLFTFYRKIEHLSNENASLKSDSGVMSKNSSASGKLFQLELYLSFKDEVQIESSYFSIHLVLCIDFIFIIVTMRFINPLQFL